MRTLRPRGKGNRLRRDSQVSRGKGPKRPDGRGLRERWKSFLPYFMVAVSLMALPIIGVQMFRYFRASGHFSVQEVMIEGNQNVSRAEILTFAGIKDGMSIMDLDEEFITTEIERHPRIRSAEVEVSLPSYVTIHVVERDAAAVVVLGRMFLADERGVVFKRVEEGDDIDGLPMITGVSPGYLTQAETAPAAEEIVREGIQLATAYAVHPVARQQALGELHYDPLFGWTLVTEESAMEVRLGAGSLAEKLDRLHHIIRDLVARGAKADVVRLDASRDPGRVAVRMQYVGGQGEGVAPANEGAAVAPNPEPRTRVVTKPPKAAAEKKVLREKAEEKEEEKRVTPKEVDSDFRGQILPQ